MIGYRMGKDSEDAQRWPTKGRKHFVWGIAVRRKKGLGPETGKVGPNKRKGQSGAIEVGCKNSSGTVKRREKRSHNRGEVKRLGGQECLVGGNDSTRQEQFQTRYRTQLRGEKEGKAVTTKRRANQREKRTKIKQMANHEEKERLAKNPEPKRVGVEGKRGDIASLCEGGGGWGGGGGGGGWGGVWGGGE